MTLSAVRSAAARLGRSRQSTAMLAVGALLLGLTAVVAAASPANAAPGNAGACSSAHIKAPTRVQSMHKIAVVMRPAGTRAGGANCAAGSEIGKSDPAVGAPPLYYHGGKVMSVSSVGNKVVVTPIFWAPSGYSFASGYKSLIVRYLKDIAAASGSATNVFATTTEYSGKNGVVRSKFTIGSAVSDTHALPANECTIDSGPVYSDNSGYTACLDDDQITAETTKIVTANGLRTDLGHMYVMFTPKQVESCFFSDAEIPPGQTNQCTINSSPDAAYCAYHSYASGNANEIYAEMPFPIYNSPVGYTCGNEAGFPTEESPNNNSDADAEISPLSHEMSEAITDPNIDAWFDAVGYENGDECAYVYGPSSGSSGAKYNQTINGHHYLTQEEFSNANFFTTWGAGGCLQGEPKPTILTVGPTSGSKSGGTTVTVHGTYFTPASKVLFGTTAGKNVKVSNPDLLKVTTPKHAAGKVKIVVETIGGKSNTASYTFK